MANSKQKLTQVRENSGGLRGGGNSDIKLIQAWNTAPAVKDIPTEVAFSHFFFLNISLIERCFSFVFPEMCTFSVEKMRMTTKLEFYIKCGL